jgi:hypothetical protein
MRRLLPLLILALALQPSHAQSVAQSPATYRIAGTVVSAVDHHPLQRASIQILTPEDQKPIQSTNSDEYGRFAFAVPAGNFTLQGTAPGYLATLYDEHDGFTTGVVTGAGVGTESLILQLQPEAILSGIIRDESAEPAEGASIHLFRQIPDFGDDRLALVDTKSADDSGRFEFAHLHPGTYFLAVTATPWYAVHPDLQAATVDVASNEYHLTLQRRGNPTFSFIDHIDPSLDVAYAATFYPGTTDPAAAAPILVRAGDAKDLDLQLRPQPALSITLHSAAPPNFTPYNQPRLQISFHGQVLPVMAQAISTGERTVIDGLAPGDYFLSDGRVSSSSADGDTPIHLIDHSITANLPAAPSPAHLHIAVQPASHTRLPFHTQVVLVRSNHEAQASKELDGNNRATLDSAPGDYSFAVLGERYDLAVGQVVSGERPLPSNSIHLAPDETASFILTVDPRVHALHGIASKDGKPFPGAFVLLVPTSQVHDIHDFYRDQSNLDGSFDLRNVPSGDYTLFAIEHGWDLNWRSYEVLAHYLPAATAIRIPNTENTPQTLKQPVPVQPR